MVRLVAGIFLSSVGAVLFSLLVFRLLSFFVMPSMFFSLLLVGFPVGAALAARSSESDFRRFRRMLAVLAAVMVLTLAATLLCKHVDYLRANFLFSVDPGRLLTQILVFALIYTPFFVAYGAAEYVGYLAGTTAFGQRMRPVYGLFLFGGAAAFGVAELLQRPLGVPRLLVVAVAMVLSGRLILSDRLRLRSIAEFALVAALLGWPGFDRTFMNWFKSSASVFNSAAFAMRQFPNTSVAHAGWGKYSYVEILRLKFPPTRTRGADEGCFGLYNDVGMWRFFHVGPRREYDPADISGWPPRDKLPFLFLPERTGSVALLGSGGGREVHLARAAGAKRILALEIEPAVVEAIQGPLREEFDHVYSTPPVQVHVGEARRYFEQTDERFDLIMMMTVGGYPQLMLEPGNMIRTAQAYRVFAEHLTQNGVLAISYDAGLDKQGVLMKQYYHTLQQLGMDTYTFVRPGEDFLLLAFRPDASIEQKARWEDARRELSVGTTTSSSADLELESFRPITDDRPFLAGNIRHVLPESRIWVIFKILAGLLVLVGFALAVWLHYGLARQPSLLRGIKPEWFLMLGVLVGANFMLVEYLCVIQLFRRLYAYYDSLIIGIIAFLTLTGLGSLLVPKRWLAGTISGTMVLSLVWWWGVPLPWGGVVGGSAHWSAPATAAMLVPMVMLTGSLFPVIFEQVPAGRLALFGMDAVGAACGGLLAFFVPMLFGFQAFSTLAVGAFVLTGMTMLVFLRAQRTAEQ